MRRCQRNGKNQGNNNLANNLERKFICLSQFFQIVLQVHFDDVSLYGTPKEEEPLPNISTITEKMSSNFLKNQLQSWFQPTDNRLAMKLFGSKKALVKERIRQKTAGHWVIDLFIQFTS